MDDKKREVIAGEYDGLHPVQMGQAKPEVDPARRWFGGMLALLGGSAALTACGGADSELSQVAQAATGSLTDAGLAGSWRIGWAEQATDLRSLDDSFAPAVLAFGSGAKGDGGEGLFVWIPATASYIECLDGGVGGLDDDGGILFKTSAAGVGFWKRIVSGPINVRWFASKIASGDHTDMIKAAVTAAARGAAASPALKANTVAVYEELFPRGATVFFPAGLYVLKSTVLISRSNVHIEGDGPGSTTISFQPTASGPAFHFFDGAGPSARIAFCSLRRMRFGAETSSSGQAKTAVVLNNADRCVVEDVGVFTNWTDSSYGSAGVRIIAGQINQVRRVTLVADVPISIDYPTGEGATTNLDHLYLADLTLGVTSGSKTANIAIAEGVYVTNFVVEGQNSFNGGKYGILWKGDMPASASCSVYCGYAHSDVYIRNIRMEGLVKDTSKSYPEQGHAIYIAMGYQGTLNQCSLQNLHIQGVRSNGGTSASDGLYLRGVQGRVESSWLLGSDKGVDVDGNVEFHQVALTDTAEPQGGMFVSRVRDLLLSTVINPGYNYRVGTLRSATMVGKKKYQRATITVLVDNAAGTVNEGGTWLVSTAGIARLSGSARTDTSTTTDRVYMTHATSGEVFLWHSLTGIDEVRFTLILEYSN